MNGIKRRYGEANTIGNFEFGDIINGRESEKPKKKGNHEGMGKIVNHRLGARDLQVSADDLGSLAERLSYNPN